MSTVIALNSVKHFGIKEMTKALHAYNNSISLFVRQLIFFYQNPSYEISFDICFASIVVIIAYFTE